MLAGCAEEDIAGEAARPGPILVKANSCNADKVCEVNYLQAKEGISTQDIYPSSGERIRIKNLILDSDDVGISSLSGTIFMDSKMETKSIEVYGDIISNGYIEAIRTRTSDLQVANLKGDGNAYACLDWSGKLFRSDTPCR